MPQTTLKEIQEFNNNKEVPYEIIDKGEGYLKILRIKETGQKVILKEFEIDAKTRKAKFKPYNPLEAIIALQKFIDKHRIYRNEEIKEKERNKATDTKGRAFEGGGLDMYEAVLPEEGGIKFKSLEPKTGYIFPELFTGAPLEEFARIAFGYKKFFAFFEKYLNIKSPIGIIRAWFLKDSFPMMIDIIHHGMRHYMLDRKGYSRSTRGLWDLCDNALKYVKDKHKDIANKIKEIVCYYIEFDFAYKYRSQDWFGILNPKEFVVKKERNLVNKALLILCFLLPPFRRRFYKPKLYSRPVREIYRIFDVLISRDYDDMKIKWAGIRDKVCLLLEFNNYITSIFQKAISETDLSTIRFDEEDDYWTTFHYEYRYNGLSIEEREKWRKDKYGK